MMVFSLVDALITDTENGRAMGRETELLAMEERTEEGRADLKHRAIDAILYLFFRGTESEFRKGKRKKLELFWRCGMQQFRRF